MPFGPQTVELPYKVHSLYDLDYILLRILHMLCPKNVCIVRYKEYSFRISASRIK